MYKYSRRMLNIYMRILSAVFAFIIMCSMTSYMLGFAKKQIMTEMENKLNVIMEQQIEKMKDELIYEISTDEIFKNVS